MSYVEPGPLGTWSDAARRAHDGVTVHIAAMHAQDNRTDRWVAIRLSDGDVSREAFPSKGECIRWHSHTDGTRCLHETQCAYLWVPPDVFPLRGAELYLKFHRQMYAAGMRLIDPDRRASREIILPMRGQGVFAPPRIHRPERQIRP